MTITDTPVSGVMAPSEISPYEFPINDEMLAKAEKISVQPSTTLLKLLREISFDRMDADGSRCSYSEVRSKVCLLNALLNIKGEIAPAYRDMRGAPMRSKVAYSHDNHLISNDRQVLDLHWVHCRGWNTEMIPGHQQMQDKSQPFKWSLASKFVNVAGSTTRKADFLRLTELEEMQLCSMVSQKTRTRRKTIQRKWEHHIRDVKTSIAAPGSKYSDEMKDSMPEIYRAILIGRGNGSSACEAYAFMTGKSIPRKTMARCIDRLKDFI